MHLDRVAQWGSASTQNWKVPYLNHTDVLSRGLRPYLVTRLPVSLGTNKIIPSDYHWVHEAASS